MRASLLAYRNSILQKQADKKIAIYEFVIYSDSIFTDEVENGEIYSFLNMLPPHDNLVSPSITVRANWFIDINKTIYSDTNSYTDDFHGGWFTDEIAALVSLKLGVRAHGGSIIRTFNYDNSEFGQPRADLTPCPILTKDRRASIAPTVSKNTAINTLDAINDIGNLQEDKFNSLIKAARNFQNSLWICESSPNLAWLMIVSALETAAVQWEENKQSPIEKFEHSKPEMFEYLNNEKYRELIPIIASEFSSTFGVTKKFLDFCLNFLPDEPEVRPAVGQIDWSRGGLKKIFNTIYGLRSKALHTGQPFPEPMSSPPFQYDGIAEAAIIGKALSTLGGTWTPKDAPINLNTFIYMAHSILNKWWNSLYTPQSSDITS